MSREQKEAVTQQAETDTDLLHGAVIEYVYSSGHHYRLIFDDDFHMRFEFLNAAEHGGPTLPPEQMPARIPYRARVLREQLVLVHWIASELAIHIVVTFDLREGLVYCAAMMPPNRAEFWEHGNILHAQLKSA